MANQQNDTYDASEAQRRFEAALKAGLSTPPVAREDVPAKRAESKPKSPKKSENS